MAYRMQISVPELADHRTDPQSTWHLHGPDAPQPETNARISQYEMAYRMQISVPELADLSKEPQSTWDLYGPEAKQPGTFAYNCLMARRMAERDVRCIQIYKRGWDMHDNVTGILPMICQETDRACYALVIDLK